MKRNHTIALIIAAVLIGVYTLITIFVVQHNETEVARYKEFVHREEVAVAVAKLEGAAHRESYFQESGYSPEAIPEVADRKKDADPEEVALNKKIAHCKAVADGYENRNAYATANGYSPEAVTEPEGACKDLTHLKAVAKLKEFVHRKESGYSPETIREVISQPVSLGMKLLWLNVLFGLIPAVIAKRKGRSFGLWWLYGTALFIVALPHSLIMEADIQAIAKRKQLAERVKQCRRQDTEYAKQRFKQLGETVNQGLKQFGEHTEQRQKQNAERAEQRRKLQQDVKNKTGGKSVPVIAIGGNGWEFLTNRKLIAGLGAAGLYLWDLEALKSYTVHSKNITDINVGGPGTVRSGGGAMGGGFGLDGFLVGAAAATVLNILTSHKTTKTLVHVKSENSEIFLLISTMEPDETRIYLSPLFVSLKSKSNTGASGIAEEIEKLVKLLADGHITGEEYANLKSRLF